MKFHTAALQFLLACEALRFGVRAQSVVVDRTSDTIVADAAVSDVLLETPVDSGGRFFPSDINNLRVVVDSVTRGDGSSSKTGSMHHTVAGAGVSDILLETPIDSGGRFSATGINNLRVGSVTRGDGSSSKTGSMHHTVAGAGVSDILLETPSADSGGRFSPSDINNHHADVDSGTRYDDGSSSKTGSIHHTVAVAGSDILLNSVTRGDGSADSTVADAGVSDILLNSVTRGDGSSSKTGTMHHTVADAGVSDVLLETDSGGSLVPPSGIINHHAVVDAINDDDEISSFTGTNVSAQRKLIKSSKKVNHPKALCTLSLFADSLFMYANKCFDDIMVTISACDDTDDTCYISERLLSLPEEDEEEEQCFVGGSFPAKQNIRYNPSTGDCEFLYVDLMDDSCNLYTGDDSTGSLGLKARINVKNNPDVMFIQFTNDRGLTFYNDDNERVAKRATPEDDRYLRQEGEPKPLLSMVTHPHRRRRRRMTDGCNDVGGLQAKKCNEAYSPVRCYYQPPRHTRSREEDVPVEYSDEARACYNPMKRCSREVENNLPKWCSSRDYMERFGGYRGSCSGTNYCLNLDFHCADGEYCELSCINSCKGVTMHCADNQFCEMQFCGNGHCVGAKVICGEGTVAQGLKCVAADRPNDCGKPILGPTVSPTSAPTISPTEPIILTPTITYTCVGVTCSDGSDGSTCGSDGGCCPFGDTPSDGQCSCGTSWSDANMNKIPCKLTQQQPEPQPETVSPISNPTTNAPTKAPTSAPSANDDGSETAVTWKKYDATDCQGAHTKIDGSKSFGGSQGKWQTKYTVDEMLAECKSKCANNESCVAFNFRDNREHPDRTFGGSKCKFWSTITSTPDAVGDSKDCWVSSKANYA